MADAAQKSGLPDVSYYAPTFRIAVEASCWAGALASPARADRVRRVAERAGALLYYASIPALLALRFLA